jgi:hypothetical protein
VQRKFNVVADAVSRVNESLSTEIYIGSEECEDSDVLSRPMPSTSMVSKLLSTYKEDKEVRKELKNPEVRRFEKSLDGILYAVKMEIGG